MIKIVINLPKRTERLKQTLENLANFFIEKKPYIHICSGVIMNSATQAVREAHKNAVRMALNEGVDKALIFEDDIVFRDNAYPYFKTLLNNLPSDYDVILFGIYSGQIFETENMYFDKVNKFSGLHMYLVSERAYEKILNYSGNQPIDHWIGLNLNCYISKKHFAYQYDGYSDNAKANTTYNQDVLSNYKSYFLE